MACAKPQERNHILQSIGETLSDRWFLRYLSSAYFYFALYVYVFIILSYKRADYMLEHTDNCYPEMRVHGILDDGTAMPAQTIGNRLAKFRPILYTCWVAPHTAVFYYTAS